MSANNCQPNKQALMLTPNHAYQFCSVAVCAHAFKACTCRLQRYADTRTNHKYEHVLFSNNAPISNKGNWHEQLRCYLLGLPLTCASSQAICTLRTSRACTHKRGLESTALFYKMLPSHASCVEPTLHIPNPRTLGTRGMLPAMVKDASLPHGSDASRRSDHADCQPKQT